MEGSGCVVSTLVSQYSDSESESEVTSTRRKSDVTDDSALEGEQVPSSTVNSEVQLSTSEKPPSQEGLIDGHIEEEGYIIAKAKPSRLDEASSGSSKDSDGDSTSADDGGSEDTSEDTQERWKRNRPILSNPFSNSVVTEASSTTGTESVFHVPFRNNEELQSALLQHHVKLTPNHRQQETINGKKICWSHRKGKCRFGHKCTFAHDSDLTQDDSVNKETSRGGLSTKKLSLPSSTMLGHNPSHEDMGSEQAKRARKRPGLSQGLIPGKKVMSQYYRS